MGAIGIPEGDDSNVCQHCQARVADLTTSCYVLVVNDGEGAVVGCENCSAFCRMAASSLQGGEDTAAALFKMLLEQN